MEIVYRNPCSRLCSVKHTLFRSCCTSPRYHQVIGFIKNTVLQQKDRWTLVLYTTCILSCTASTNTAN